MTRWLTKSKPKPAFNRSAYNNFWRISGEPHGSRARNFHNLNEFTHLDLFTGIGGFAIGFQNAGFRTIAFAETDPDASLVLRHHWPHIPNLGDVKLINKQTFRKNGCRLRLPLVITGGVPCQPASLLGQMRGTSDERWLWPEAIRVVRELRPRYAVFENPPSLLILEGGRAFGGNCV